MKKGGYLWAYSKVARLEYLPAIIPGLIIALILSLPTVTSILSIYFVEAIIGLFMAYLSGFIINALGDYEIDKTYGTYKSEIPMAVDTFGWRGTWILLFIHVVVPIGFTVHLALLTSRYIIIPLLLIGYVFGLGYSYQPFNFKVRGIWHPISLASSAMLIPLLYIYALFYTEYNPWAVIAIFGFTITHYSLAITNQAVDYFEDKRYGVENPTVKFGLERSLKCSFVGQIIGLFILTTALIFFISSIVFTSTFSIYYGFYISVFIVLTVSIGYLIPLKGTLKLHKIADTPSLSERAKSELMKRAIKYPKWQASGLITVMLILLSALFVSWMAPIPNASDKPIEVNNIDYSVDTEIEVYLVRNNFGYVAIVNFTVTNEGIEIPANTTYIIWTLRHQNTIIGGKHKIPIEYPIFEDVSAIFHDSIALPDKTNFTIAGEVVCDLDNDGFFDKTLNSFSYNFEVNDLYFPLEPTITTDRYSNILYTAVKFNVINLGTTRGCDNVYVRITAWATSNPDINLVNITVYPEKNLGIDYNWSETKIFSVPLFGEYVLKLELCEDTAEGRKVRDMYSTRIELFFF